MRSLLSRSTHSSTWGAPSPRRPRATCAVSRVRCPGVPVGTRRSGRGRPGSALGCGPDVGSRRARLRSFKKYARERSDVKSNTSKLFSLENLKSVLPHMPDWAVGVARLRATRAKNTTCGCARADRSLTCPVCVVITNFRRLPHMPGPVASCTLGGTERSVDQSEGVLGSRPLSTKRGLEARARQSRGVSKHGTSERSWRRLSLEGRIPVGAELACGKQGAATAGSEE